MLWPRERPSSRAIWKHISEEHKSLLETIELAHAAVGELDPGRPPADWPDLHVLELFEIFDEYIHFLFAGSRRQKLSAAVSHEIQAALDSEYACLLAITGLALFGAVLDAHAHGDDYLWIGVRNAPRLKQFIWLRERIAANLQVQLPRNWSKEITELQFYSLSSPAPIAHRLILTEAYRLAAAHPLVKNCIIMAVEAQSYHLRFSRS